jgi:hypothetical protein
MLFKFVVYLNVTHSSIKQPLMFLAGISGMGLHSHRVLLVFLATANQCYIAKNMACARLSFALL